MGDWVFPLLLVAQAGRHIRGGHSPVETGIRAQGTLGAFFVYFTPFFSDAAIACAKHFDSFLFFFFFVIQ